MWNDALHNRLVSYDGHWEGSNSCTSWFPHHKLPKYIHEPVSDQTVACVAC
jgi:hypothetical protein